MEIEGSLREMKVVINMNYTTKYSFLACYGHKHGKVDNS